MFYCPSQDLLAGSFMLGPGSEVQRGPLKVCVRMCARARLHACARVRALANMMEYERGASASLLDGEGKGIEVYV